MNVTIYNPTNERIGCFAHNRKVTVPPMNSATVSEKMAKALLAKDSRLTLGMSSYDADQIKAVSGLKKNALVVLARSLMRGVPITLEEARIQADGLRDETAPETDPGDPGAETDPDAPAA